MPSYIYFFSGLHGALFSLVWVQIMDPMLASYGVDNPINAAIQLAQTTMRIAIGKMTLDKTFEERESLNDEIVVFLSSLLLLITMKIKNLASSLEP